MTTLEILVYETLHEKRSMAGKIGGYTTSLRYPRDGEYMSRLGKLGGRPRKPTIEELLLKKAR